jgi:hypothetical protein
VEVFTGPERRRDWPDERKIAIVSESLEPGVNVSELARRHEINPQQLFGWRRRFRADAEAYETAFGIRPQDIGNPYGLHSSARSDHPQRAVVVSLRSAMGHPSWLDPKVRKAALRS